MTGFTMPMTEREKLNANGEELGKEAVKAANSLKKGAIVMSISKIG